MTESEVQEMLQINAVGWNAQLMRNNSGALKDQTGRHVRFGLGNVSKKHNDKIKSSDLIGFTKVTVTPEMVGKTIAVFTAVEVKDPNWNPDKKLDAHEKAQEAFINWIKANGGFAGFANSIEAFRNIIK